MIDRFFSNIDKPESHSSVLIHRSDEGLPYAQTETENVEGGTIRVLDINIRSIFD